jgi:hypothetical protein
MTRIDSGPICPDCSAMAMNSAGSTRPRRGEFHRARHLEPVELAGIQADQRLEEWNEFVAFDRRADFIL